MTYTVTLTVAGQTYLYPDGPTLPNYFVLPQLDGRIVFHYGVLGALPADQDPKQPSILGPYNVKIEDGGVVLQDRDVPSHWWNAHWTYYPSITGVKATRTPAQIVAARRLFPFGDTGCVLPDQKPTPPCFIMGSSNITIYMPTTGERPDIGLVTDNSGYYMLGRNPDGLLQWGLAGSTCPNKFRDQNTGRPIDLLKYFSANAYDAPGYQGSPWLAKGKQAASGYTEYGGGWTPQQAHYCEMSYVAYQATKNLSFLEDLQYSANFTVLCDAAKSGAAGKPIISGEYRGVAWALRNLFMAHVATLDAETDGALPDGCMPSDYWKALLDIQLAYYSNYMADPANQYYRLVCGPSDHLGPWQCDYMLISLAFGVLSGHSDWTPLYLWALKNAIDRTSNQSSYTPGYGGAYYLPTAPHDWWGSLLAGWPPDQPPLTPAQIATLTADPLNGGSAMVGSEYLMTTRAVLVMADYLDKQGIAAVRAVYPELDACIQICTTMNKSYGAMNPRVSVVSNGAIIMPSAVTINLGQKVHLDVAFTGPKPPSPPSYSQSDSTVGALSAGDMAGVLFTSVKIGKSTVTATATGVSGPISGMCEVSVTNPLPTAITLTPGQIS